ncbi:MAG: TIGR00730 family Rossman fold protein [Bacteroides sp.]|jgi:uncharacterized protein (TIGR00730 family)|nr:TIGR00730 family Rossman fold protein [Bacteroides sp.]
MRICVFCSSSNFLDERFYEEARLLGTLIGKEKFKLVYGGTHVGLMGALALAVKEEKGLITGVIPQLIFNKGIAYDGVDELIVTRDLRERKATMERISDAFIALPGGFGTLEEFFELVTLKQLQVHFKPLVIINTLGYFDELIVFFERLFKERFASDRFRNLIYVADNPAKSLQYISEYKPEFIADKWTP